MGTYTDSFNHNRVTLQEPTRRCHQKSTFLLFLGWWPSSAWPRAWGYVVGCEVKWLPPPFALLFLSLPRLHASDKALGQWAANSLSPVGWLLPEPQAKNGFNIFKGL